MKPTLKNNDLILHVQEVSVNWSKKTRSGRSAQVRNELPVTYLIETPPKAIPGWKN